MLLIFSVIGDIRSFLLRTLAREVKKAEGNYCRL